MKSYLDCNIRASSNKTVIKDLEEIGFWLIMEKNKYKRYMFNNTL